MGYWKRVWARAFRKAVKDAALDTWAGRVKALVSSVGPALLAVAFIPASTELLVRTLGALGAALILPFIFVIGRLLEVPAAMDREKDERIRTAELKEGLQPTIDVYLDPATKGVSSVLMQTGGVVHDSRWVMLSVRPTNDAALNECEVHVLSFVRDGAPPPAGVGTIRCKWDNRPELSLTIRPGVTEQACLLTYTAFSNQLELPLVPPKSGLFHYVQEAGTYRVEVAIAATGATTVKKAVTITWTGNPDELTATLAEAA
jgi:hypothetical protein